MEEDQTPPLLRNRSDIPQLPPEGPEESSQHIKAAAIRLLKTFSYHSPYCRCFPIFPSGLRPHIPPLAGCWCLTVLSENSSLGISMGWREPPHKCHTPFPGTRTVIGWCGNRKIWTPCFKAGQFKGQFSLRALHLGSTEGHCCENIAVNFSLCQNLLSSHS